MVSEVAATGGSVRSLAVEARVQGPAREVWEVWTTEEGIDSWWAPHGARIDLRVGGAFEILFLPDAPPGEQGAEGCRFLAYVPGEMVAFTWRATPDHPLRDSFTWVVVFFDEIEPSETAVRLVHTGFLVGPEWDTYLSYFERAWRHVLDLLVAHWAP